MFRNESMAITVATGSSLAGGGIACWLGWSGLLVVATDWAGFYLPLLLFRTLRAQRLDGRGYL